MNIAVATIDGECISNHFGRSPLFAIYQLEENEIVDKILRKNTFTNHFRQDHVQHSHAQDHQEHEHHGHKSVYEGLKDCQVVICRGMGQRAWDDLTINKMEVITTEEINCDDAVNKYLKGILFHEKNRLHQKS